MPYKDFRAFIDVLREHGELIEINTPTSLPDVGKALKQAYMQGRPAVQLNATGTDFPLIAGVYADRKKALLAFEATEETIREKVLKGLSTAIPPKIVSGPQPCQEVVIKGADIDITRFPIPKYSPKDGGQYITPGIVASKDPETGVPDIGHYRFLILSPTTMS